LTLFAQDRYTIEVLSIENNASISTEFMSKVHELGLPYIKKDMGGELKVFVGEYKSKASAESALKEVQAKLNKEAFVCESSAKPLTSQQKMQQAMLMAKARTLKKMDAQEVKVIEKKLQSIEPVQEKMPLKRKMQASKEKSIEPMNKDVEAKERSSKTSENVFCKSSKKALRETEIAQALSFYKNSSFYSFKE